MARGGTVSETLGRIGNRSRRDSHVAHQIGPVSTHFTAHALHASTAELLSVAAVAERLKVCTATVYKLCGEMHLPHLRIRNAIRIAAKDLDTFVIRSRQRRKSSG